MLEKKLNAEAWDYEAKRGNFWTRPVNDEDVLSARNGKILVRLTPSRFVKESWVKGTKGSRMLLLASAGGQQSVLFSAYGADITSIDISKEQIRRDEETLEKYGLEGRTIVGDMCDLSMFDDSSFDYVFIPHSINFISSLSKLYSEVVRVLKDGGHFLFGCANPVLYVFDEKKEMRGKSNTRSPSQMREAEAKRKKRG